MTYLLLNCVFMAVTLLALRHWLPTANRTWYLTLLILVIMTAVFDNVIISLGIVAYDPEKILGLYIYRAPIEDFFYALLAVYIVPALWNIFDKKTTNQSKEPTW